MVVSAQKSTIETIPPFWYSKYLDENVTKFDYPVCIIGETGTCRSFVAEAIHNLCEKRRNKPFIFTNCIGIEKEANLFDIIGSSKGGTVFLDEITELPDKLQIILSDYIDRNLRIGQGHPSNSRIIVGSKVNLKRQADKKNIREKLLYHLSVLIVKIPPLRKRRHEIPSLVNYILLQEAKKNKFEQISIQDDALQALIKYPWSGNLTQLQQTIKYAIVKCVHSFITIEDLPSELFYSVSSKPKRGPSPILGNDSVANALKRTGGNKTRAAKLLGVGRARYQVERRILPGRRY